MKYTISVLVENQPGVLSKVAGLFSRRGFNIDSLAVGITEDPAVSRITICLLYTSLGVAKGTRLIAQASCVKDGRTTCYYRIDVRDDLGNPVAAVNTTGYHTA